LFPAPSVPAPLPPVPPHCIPTPPVLRRAPASGAPCPGNRGAAPQPGHSAPAVGAPYPGEAGPLEGRGAARLQNTVAKHSACRVSSLALSTLQRESSFRSWTTTADLWLNLGSIVISSGLVCCFDLWNTPRRVCALATSIHLFIRLLREVAFVFPTNSAAQKHQSFAPH
jgi:hypothetical protein